MPAYSVVLAVNIPSLSVLLSQVFNGLVLGMIFILIALGLSIIFGMLGVINFAHGDMLLVGTYVAWVTVTRGGPFWLALVIAPAVVGVLGFIFERLALRRIYDENVLVQVLLTFGFAEFLRAGVEFIWGGGSQNFQTPAWGSGSVDLVLFTYPSYRIFLIVFAGLLVATVYILLTRTDLGLVIRAGTQDREMVDFLGIDTTRIYLYVFVLGAVLAGIAGVLIAPVRGVNPRLGVDLLIPAFVVIVIGGIGSFRGTIVAGLLIGQLTAITSIVYSPGSDIIIFVAMAIILLLRPRGLFGQEGVFH
jgi:branched-chain amino acid transport system permease protein